MIKRITKVTFILATFLIFKTSCGAADDYVDYSNYHYNYLEEYEQVAEENLTLWAGASQGGLFDFASDASLLVDAVEEVHPIFILDGLLPDYYQRLREEFLAYTAVPITNNISATLKIGKLINKNSNISTT